MPKPRHGKNCQKRHESREIKPEPPGYLLVPFDCGEVGDYFEWTSINEVIPVNVTGVVTSRDHFVTDFDREPLLERMRTFLDRDLSDGQVRERLGLKENYAWRISAARPRRSCC